MSAADFNIKITVRNARLLRLVRERFGTSAEMARATGIGVSSIAALMSMKKKPIRNDGEWTLAALNIAGAFGADPADIWPAYLRERALRSATAEMELTAAQVGALVAPEEDPMETIERRDTVARLMACLSERERHVIEQRMGGATLDEISDEGMHISRGRIQQIEQRALRKMRDKAAVLRLTPPTGKEAR